MVEFIAAWDQSQLFKLKEHIEWSLKRITAEKKFGAISKKLGMKGSLPKNVELNFNTALLFVIDHLPLQVHMVKTFTMYVNVTL